MSLASWAKKHLAVRLDSLGRRARPTIPAPDRFWAKVDCSGDCWEWTAYRKPNGYGSFGIDRRTTEYAHRMAYQLSVGPIPDGLYVCHRCDNPACVRPDHLFLGTQFDNMRDGAAKGRVGVDPWTHCKHGHEFTAANTATDHRSGKRRCRTCHSVRGASNRTKYDRSKYETSEYRRATYLKHREKRIAAAAARYHQRKMERAA